MTVTENTAASVFDLPPCPNWCDGTHELTGDGADVRHSRIISTIEWSAELIARVELGQWEHLDTQPGR